MEYNWPVQGGGSGNVVGPGSSTDNSVPRFDGITGELLQDSGVIIDDSNNMSGVASLIVSGLTASRALTTDGSKQLTSSATTATELGYVSGVTSAIQTQLDGKQASDADLTALAGLSTTGIIVRTGAGTASTRTVTGTSNRITVSNGDGVSGDPILDIGTDVVTLAGSQTLTNKTITSPSGLVKADVGLGSVDNTSDANKPVSSAQQTALDLKANIASPTFTGTVSGITASMVGLGNVDNTSDATKNAATVTLTNKTITSPSIGSPTFSDYTLFTETTAPATPSSGKLAIFAKSDHKLYKKDSNGTESELGSGGTSLINYINNYDFETGATTGWATYKDAAATTPVDGTGGSPTTITLSANSSSPLRGSYDLKFAKSAANGQGEGGSYDFTIKTPDKSKKLQISFDLNTSHASYSAGDVVIYVYDVTNSTLITPSSVSVPKMTGSWNVTFDSTTSTSYRLIFHISTTNASAYDLYFDTVVVGPGLLTQGAAISDAVTWTPTGSWTANTAYEGRYWRIGSRGKFWVKMTLTGAPTTASLTVNMPSGLTIDSSNIYLLANIAPLGVAQGSPGYPANFQVVSNGTSTSSVAVVYQNAAATGAQVAVTQALPTTWANGHYIELLWEVPIAEWAGNGTVNLGPGAQVEYAYNSDVTDASTTASGFAYGPGGTQFGSFSTANRTKRVRFQYPVQADDMVVLETYSSAGWSPVETGEFVSLSATTGMSLRPVSGSTTDYDVFFGSGGYPATAVGSSGAWSTVAANANYKWRVRKAKASAPVGFGKADSSSSGLVNPRKGQYSLTVTSGFAGWATTRAVGIYYQDQDGNHRLKFNIRGTKTSGATTGGTITVSGVTFKNVSSYEQACAGFTNSGLPIGTYTSPNTSNIGVGHASQTTDYYSISGDVELESKPSWA